MGAIWLALVAGVLSTLSPCVLPLLPMVIGASIGEHSFGPVALAAGPVSNWAQSRAGGFSAHGIGG